MIGRINFGVLVLGILWMSFSCTNSLENADCGGVIKLSNDSRTFVQYYTKAYVAYDESCVWTFVAEAGQTINKMFLLVESLDITYAQIAFFDGNLDGRNIGTADLGKSLEFSTALGFLYYQQNENAYANSFKVSVIGLNSGQPGPYQNEEAFLIRSTDCPFKFNYPESYEQLQNALSSLSLPNSRVSIVFQPNMTTGHVSSLSLDYETSNRNVDSLFIYTLPVMSSQLAPALEGSNKGFSTVRINNMTSVATPRILFLYPSNLGATISGFLEIKQWCK